MKQTAVEWLINEHFGGIENCTPDFKNKIKQAKEMEKEQMIEFACEVAEASAEKYIQGKTTWQIAEELLTKQQKQ
jgi:hypothetical protein